MPVHLRNVPPNVQHELDVILWRLRCRMCLMSDDYIIVFSPDEESHTGHFKPIRTLLVEGDVTLDLQQ